MLRPTHAPASLRRMALAVSGAAVLAAGPAAAQLAGDRATEQPVAEEGTTNPTPGLDEWDPATIETLTYITDLTGEEVFAPDGTALGEVDDVLISNREMTLFGLLLDNGLVVPFGDVSMSVRGDTTVITAPAHGYAPVDDVEGADLMPDREGMQPTVFKADEVMDRHMLLNGAVRFGDVTNLAFDETGRLIAVEAQYAATPPTRYALPIPVGTIVDADAEGFYLPYDFEEVKLKAPVDATASR